MRLASTSQEAEDLAWKTIFVHMGRLLFKGFREIVPKENQGLGSYDFWDTSRVLRSTNPLPIRPLFSFRFLKLPCMSSHQAPSMWGPASFPFWPQEQEAKVFKNPRTLGHIMRLGSNRTNRRVSSYPLLASPGSRSDFNASSSAMRCWRSKMKLLADGKLSHYTFSRIESSLHQESGRGRGVQVGWWAWFSLIPWSCGWSGYVWRLSEANFAKLPMKASWSLTFPEIPASKGFGSEKSNAPQRPFLRRPLQWERVAGVFMASPATWVACPEC